jgi:solute carrier family 27 fatty acid transporter 1/4
MYVHLLQSFAELLMYIYTSGTTGPPKAAKIMNHRFHFMSDGLGMMLGLLPSDVVYCALPLYHSNGGILGAGQMILRGCTLVIRRKFSASQFWNDCITYGCTVVQYIGEICRYLLSQPKKPTDNQHFVRLAMGNGLKRDFWKPFQERFNIPQIGELYGATEGNASMVNITNRVGSCGFTSIFLEGVHPLTLIKFDLATGDVVRGKDGFCRCCLPGEPGLMVAKIRENTVHKIDGYGSEAATRKKILMSVFKEGDRYFNTGDVLTKDEEGYFYFCDRTGDTFRWKGENVSTFEVESVMSKHLGNRDVIVYGVEVSGCEGRAGMAAVVDPDGTLNYQDILGQLKGCLPTYAVPLFVRIIKEATVTGTSKYQKTSLKKEAFNVSIITDQIFFLHPNHRDYVPFTEEILRDLEECRIRL